MKMRPDVRDTDKLMMDQPSDQFEQPGRGGLVFAQADDKRWSGEVIGELPLFGDGGIALLQRWGGCSAGRRRLREKGQSFRKQHGEHLGSDFGREQRVGQEGLTHKEVQIIEAVGVFFCKQ